MPSLGKNCALTRKILRPHEVAIFSINSSKSGEIKVLRNLQVQIIFINFADDKNINYGYRIYDGRF